MGKGQYEGYGGLVNGLLREEEKERGRGQKRGGSGGGDLYLVLLL